MMKMMKIKIYTENFLEWRKPYYSSRFEMTAEDWGENINGEEIHNTINLEKVLDWGDYQIFKSAAFCENMFYVRKYVAKRYADISKFRDTNALFGDLHSALDSIRYEMNYHQWEFENKKGAKK